MQIAWNKFPKNRKPGKISKTTIRDFRYYIACLSESLYDLFFKMNEDRLIEFFITLKKCPTVMLSSYFVLNFSSIQVLLSISNHNYLGFLSNSNWQADYYGCNCID